MFQDQSSPRRRFGLRFVMLARQWRHALNLRLADIGFSDARWAPLMHLDQLGDGINQKELAARLGLEPSTLVRTLDILSAEGLVERRDDPADRRARRIVLTAPGREAVEAIRAVLTQAEADMLGDLDDPEIKVLLDSFDKIEKRLKS